MESQKGDSLENASAVWYFEKESWYMRTVYMEIGAVFTGYLSNCSFPHCFYHNLQ